jgi:cysteine desulfurase NifS/selenium donor protein
MKPIYLDYNATTPLAPEVQEALRTVIDDVFGNPSSSHAFGVRARGMVEDAREQVARLIGCRPDEVVFTSGGTESNNYALLGVARARADDGRHVIVSSIEHPSVLEVCTALEGEGFRVTYLPVDREGLVAPDELERAMGPETILVSIMHANNEVGSLQPIGELAAVARERGATFHTDAAQSAGKIRVKVDELGVDLLTLAGHKLYAPKGIGTLYMREGTPLDPPLRGAGQELGRRAGTENVMGIVAFGVACNVAEERLEEFSTHMRTTRDRLFRRLKESLPRMHLNGHPEMRLPNTLSVAFPGLEADGLLTELREVAASPGAACHTGSADISHVLLAMGVPKDLAVGTVRFSTGRSTTADEVDRAAEIVAEAVQRLQPGEEESVSVTSGGADVALTQFTRGLGCACKLEPALLEEVLQGFRVVDERLIAGAGDDDSAVFRWHGDRLLVQTVDFLTPVVDDPYWFGAIAASNSLSDVYAMGGKPLIALAVAAFPSRRLPVEVLKAIMRGARDKAGEAGVVIAGGHSVEDNEPKFGLVVTGEVEPDAVWRKGGLKPGDLLLLTKPLGLGILTTATKRGMASEEQSKEAVETMATLNATARDVLTCHSPNACTDVTGFGLLGHLKEMVLQGGAHVTVWGSEVPTLPGVSRLVREGAVPGGTIANTRFVSDVVTWDPRVSQTLRTVLCDAQTSGGLLAALPESAAAPCLEEMRAAGISGAALIGRVEEARRPAIRVVGDREA